MFLRIGVCCGPIVEADDQTVTIELLTPYERDGERLKLEIAPMLPFAKNEIAIWRELRSARLRRNPQ